MDNISIKDITYWIIVVVLLIIIYRLLSDNSDDSDELEPFTNSEEKSSEEANDKLELSNSEVKTLKNFAKAYASGKVTMPNLRITGEMVIDGGVHCRKNLTAQEVNGIRVSGNVLDGATVKGEIVKDNNGILVKRGQRVRLTDGNGYYQVWTVEKDEKDG